MAAAAAGGEVAAPEGGVKASEGVGEGGGEGEVVVKSVPNEELNSKIAHDIVSGVTEAGEVDESVVAVAGSVDGSVEAPGGVGGEPAGSVGGDAAPSGDVVHATEKVESWDLSEAVAKNVQEEDSKPKFFEEGSGEGVDAEDASVVSIDSIEDSVGEKPVSGLPSDDVEGDPEHAEGVSAVAGGEGFSREIPGEGSVEKVESQAVDAPVEEVHEAVEATTSAEPKEEPASPEVVPLPSDDIEETPVEVNSRDINEVASILPTQSAENEDVSPKLPVEGPSDNVDGETVDAPVDSEGLVPGVDDKVVEPTSIGKVDEGSLEPDSVLAPADNVDEKSTEVNSEDTSKANAVLPSEESAENKDVSPELPAEGAFDKVDSETLEAPVDSKGLEPEVDDTVVEPTTSAKADEGSAEPAEPEPVSAPADEVEEKSIEVNSEDTSEANALLPSEESAENKDISPELPAEGPFDKVDSETLEAPVDSKGLEPEVDDKFVEPSSIAEADEGSAESAELQSVSIPADDVEEKSVEVNSEDTSEANAMLPFEESAEGSSDKVDGEVLEAPIHSEGPDAQVVHEVVVPATSAEAGEGSLESEPVSAPPDNVEEKPTEVNSEDTSETNVESAENKDVSPELEPPEGSVDKVDGEALEAPIDSEGPDAHVVHEVVEPTTSAEAGEGSLESEPVLSAAEDVEEKSVEVKSENTGEANTEFPLESAEIKDVSPGHPVEGPSNNVDGEGLEAPVDSEGLDAQVVHEVVEPATSAEAGEGSLESEPVSAPADNVEEKPTEVNSEDTSETNVESAENKDVSPELEPAEGSVDNVDGEALEAPIDSEGPDAHVVHEVVEPTTSAEAGEGSLESEPVSAPPDNVEEKPTEVNSEDPSETNVESAENKDVSPELEPPEGSVDKVDGEALEAPIDSEGPDAHVVHEVVEPTTSAEADKGSLESEPVSAPPDNVEEKPTEVNSEDTSETNVESAENKDVSPELEPPEGSVDKVDGEALEAPIDSEGPDAHVVHEVVEPTTSAEADKGSLESEPVLAAADEVDDKPVEVKSEDTGETNTELPLESVEIKDVSPGHPVEGPSDSVDSEELAAPVDSEGLDAQVVHEVVEPVTSAEAYERSAEPESVSAPVDIEDKSVEVKFEDMGEANTELPLESAENKDVRPGHSVKGPSDNVDGEALEAPVDSEESDSQVVHEVVEPATSAEAAEGSLESEPVSAPAYDVEEKSIEVNSEDTRVTNAVLPTESTGNQDVNPDLEPAEGSVDKVSKEVTLYAPVEEVREVVEANNREPREESTESGSVSLTPDDVEDKSLEVSEAMTALASADNEVVTFEPPAEESSDNISSAALEPEAVDEVVEPATSAEPVEESAESESVSALDHVEDISVQVASEDTSEAATVLPSESADSKVGSDLRADKIDEIGESEDVPTEAKHDEGSPEPEFVSTPDATEDKSVDVGSGDVTQAITEPETTDNEVVNSQLSSEESADAQAPHAVMESIISEEPVKELSEPEFVSAPSDNVEDKSVDVNSEDVTEVTTASESADNEDSRPKPSVEEPSENVGNEVTLYAPAEEVHEVLEATVHAEPEEDSAEMESVTGASDDMEDDFVMVNSKDVAEASTELESADNKIVHRELPAEESAGNVSSRALELEPVDEAVEPATSAEPGEESAEPKSVSAPDHVEDEFVEVSSEDTSEAVTVLPSDGSENELVSRELPAGGTAENVSSETTVPEAAHEVVEPTISAEADEGSAEPESLSASDNVEGKSVEVSSEATGDAVTILPSGGAENELVSRELHAEGSADKVNASVEEIGKIEDAATNAKPDESTSSLEPVAAHDAQTTPEEVEPEVSAPEMEESIMATSTPFPAEEEHEQSEVSPEGSRGNEDDSIRVDTVSDTKENDTAEHTSRELLAGADSGDAPNNPQGLSSEEPSDLSLESHEKSLSPEDGAALVDRCIQMEELPQHIAAESQRSVSADTEVNAGDEERIAEGGDIIKEGGSETQPLSANGDFPVEDASHMLMTEMTDEEAVHVATQPVKDVSDMLQTEMTDKEVKLAAAHHPENNVAPEETVEDETPALESESSHEKPLIPPAESSGASQANEVETVSREFSEAPTTGSVARESDDESHDAVTSEQVTPYLATALASASGEKGNSSVAATTDTSPLEISNPPPVVKNEMAPKSYNLDEVAHNLHDAAEKTLEDAKSSNIEDGQTSVAHSVAQIVVDESSKTGDSMEYISGVVQDVAQLAQNAAQSDPNILPDTVARVFDSATGASPANEASQAKVSFVLLDSMHYDMNPPYASSSASVLFLLLL